MLMKNFRTKLCSNNFMKIPKKMIYYNPQVGYYTPESEDYFTEVKEWLIKTNPKLLCVYVTNSWNPICKKGDTGYNEFVRKNSKAMHLKINSDLHPKLRWFFDARMEPNLRILYHGALVKSIGGCNFEKFEKNLTRIYDYINNVHRPSSGVNSQYEMPYYKWEHDLEFTGREQDFDGTGSFFFGGWRGQYTIRDVPDDKLLAHERMKK